jgi:hypothetical protein
MLAQKLQECLLLHVNYRENRGICFVEGIKWKANLVNRYKHFSRHFNVQTNKTYYTTVLMPTIYNIHVEPM